MKNATALARELYVMANYLAIEEEMPASWCIPLPVLVTRICSDKEQSPVLIALIAVKLAQYLDDLGS